MSPFKFFSIVPLIILYSTSLRAEVTSMPRQMIILQGGVEEIKGTLISGLSNAEQTPQKFRGELWLPKETADFTVIEGASQDNVSFDDQKHMILEADIPPGQTTVVITFVVKVRRGAGELNFTVPSMPPEQVVFIWPEEDHLKVSAMGFRVTTAPKMGKKELLAITNADPLIPASILSINVSGVAEGRYDFWVLGGIFALLLVGISLFLTLRGVKTKSFART